jgi:hypothetical protein
MEQFIKRLKSFTWRLGAFLAVAGIAWVSDNIGLLELPLWTQGLAGLALGELTKYLNTR